MAPTRVRPRRQRTARPELNDEGRGASRASDNYQPDLQPERRTAFLRHLPQDSFFGDDGPHDLLSASSPPLPKLPADMAYIAPIHRASSVRHALKLNFLDPEEECLVIAKANRLEFHVLTAEGLALRHTRTIYGQVVMLERLRPSSSTTDHLFVGTDRHMYFTVSWDPTTRQLRTVHSFNDLADPNGRDSQSRDRCIIDQRRQFLTMEIFEGVLTVVPIHTKQPKGKRATEAPVDIGNLTDDYHPLRISEIMVRSSTYLNYKTESPKEHARIASLYEDNQERAWLKVRTLAPDKGLEYIDFEDEFMVLNDKLDPTASHLIPVPNPVNGMIILSETRLTWSDGMKEGGGYKIQPLEEATSWCAWAHIEDWRWLLADEYGWLYFLMLEFDETDDAGNVLGFKLDKLHPQVSTPSTLVHLGGGAVYVGSHSGDSQVVQITHQGLSIIQTHSNIAPIVDVAVMDMGSRDGEGQVNEYSSGQARLVTGSGAWQDGSLRSVRSGVGVEEFGGIEIGARAGLDRAATDMFHIRIPGGNKPGDLLLVSYVDDTRMFLFAGDGSVEEVQCMVHNEPTILALPLSAKGQIVQCTDRSVTVYDQHSFEPVAHWKVSGSQRIVTASASDDGIVLSLGGTELVVLDFNPSATELQVIGRRTFNDQISCIDLPHIDCTWQSNASAGIVVPFLHGDPMHRGCCRTPAETLARMEIADWSICSRVMTSREQLSQ